MPRPIFNNNNEKKNSININGNSQSSERKINAIRQKRSKRMEDLIHKLDAGGAVVNRHAIDEIINEMRQQFPELKEFSSGKLIGIAAKCYLGDDYEVHTVDFAGNIIVHYHKGEAMPGQMERARTLAISGIYEYIEVYEGMMCAVSENGKVSIIKI